MSLQIVAKAVRIHFLDPLNTGGGNLHGRFDFEMTEIAASIAQYNCLNEMSSSFDSDWTNPELFSARGFMKSATDTDFWIKVDFPAVMTVKSLYLQKRGDMCCSNQLFVS
jgi:hypothetical protein